MSRNRRSKRNTVQKPIVYSVPLLTRGQNIVLHLLIALWAVSVVVFYWWWFQPEHVGSFFGMALTTLLVSFTVLIPGYFFFFATRAKKPNSSLLIPDDGRVQFITTKTPGEPFVGLVDKKLVAMLKAAEFFNQTIALQRRARGERVSEDNYPDLVDIVLSDENPTVDTDTNFLSRMSVLLYTRLNKLMYHTVGLRFRSRAKQGNIDSTCHQSDLEGRVYAYRVFMDLDHMPSRTYLVEMIRPFADPTVGAVACSSICDSNAKTSAAAKGRLNLEAAFHGIMQAGPNPTLIGSSYAVRVAAHRSLVHYVVSNVWAFWFAVILRRPLNNVVTEVHGTLGPELAEDHSTTVAMRSRGWRVAFAWEAIAHGDGAESYSDSAVQVFQWARSLTVILLKWFPMYSRTIAPTRNLAFLFNEVWYIILSLQMLVGVMMAPIALITGQPWVNVDYVSFTVMSTLVLSACLLPIFYLRKLGTFRPADAPVLSLNLLFFRLFEWPWALWGVIHGIVGTLILNKELPFKVTPKGVKGAKPLPVKVMFPYLLIVLVQLAAVLLAPNPGQARGYVFLCLVTSVWYLGTMIYLIAQHVKENKAELTIPVIRYVPLPLAFVTISLLIFVAAIIHGWPGILIAMGLS